MRIVLFTLCEGAFNSGGKLTIVNTFDDILAKEYPMQCPMGMALKLLIPKEEICDCDLKICVHSCSGEQKLHELNAHIPAPKGENADQDFRVAVATNIHGLLFSSSGDYQVDITANEELIGSFPFKAIKQS